MVSPHSCLKCLVLKDNINSFFILLNDYKYIIFAIFYFDLCSSAIYVRAISKFQTLFENLRTFCIWSDNEEVYVMAGFINIYAGNYIRSP